MIDGARSDVPFEFVRKIFGTSSMTKASDVKSSASAVRHLRLD